MIRRLWLLGIVSLTCQLVAQQAINSKGDHNTNVNGNTVIVVSPVVSTYTEKILRAETKRVFGSSEHWEGVLLPASDRLSISACRAFRKQVANRDASSPLINLVPQEGAITVRLGTNDFECSRPSCNVIRTENKNLIWISRKNGLLMVEARILTTDGKIIASIEKNQFFVNRNQTYRPPVRADKSSLEVFDQRGETVLKLRFADKRTLILEGVFNDGDGRKVIVGKDNISFRNSFSSYHTSGNCFVTPSTGEFSPPGIPIGDFVFGGDVPKDHK